MSEEGEEADQSTETLQEQIDLEDTSARNEVLGSRIIPIAQQNDWQNYRMNNNGDFDLDQAQMLAYQGPMTTLLMQQTMSSSQEEDIIGHTRQENWDQQWLQMYNRASIEPMINRTSDYEANYNSLQERNESSYQSTFSFTTQSHDEHDDYFVAEVFNNQELNNTSIFESMQVQEIDSRAIRTQHNTSASSRIATCQNDNTYAWNLSDYSVVEQSLQPPTDWDERNGSQELTEEEVEEFIRKEQEAAADGNNADTDSKYTPQIGMEFKTRDDAHHFFGFYGFIAGFEVVVTHTTRTTSKKRNNEIYKQEMRCHRYGKGTQKKTEEQEEQEQMHDEAKKKGAKRKTNIQVKSNCPVLMEVKLENDKWKVVRLDLDHNHELSPQNRNQLFSGRKYMTDMEKSMIRTLNNNNIPTRKMIAILSYLRGNVTALPYKAKHVQNERTKINREVKGNDMNKVIHYFMKRAAEDSTFFYKLHVDEENKVKSIYWREGISLKWYAEYGDFLSFDTTYMTNRYNLPVAPIVGISGHGHTIIFGCAFISDETTETFKWLFETFLESMGGKHPKTIITDQDQAMRAAIATVMPQTTHRNCFFHIKSKCYNKNGRCFAKNEGLPERFEDIVNNSVTEEEFEYLWQKMIADYKLEQNKYFNKMWENRNRFIPVYFKEDFYPFLQSTGRSEQTNARLKDNVGPTYSIHSFIIEYQRIIDRISIMENTEDNVSKQKRPKELQTGYKIELQAAELYNRNIFLKFQFQLKMTERLKYKETEDGKCFEVWHKSNRVHQLQTNRKYIVLTDLTKGKEEFSCICAKFSKDGILCCHILKVIVEEEIDEIPEKYFIDRWRKKESKLIRRQPEETPATNELLRFNVLSRKAALLTSKGSKSEDLMTYLDEEFDRINQEMDLIKQAIEEEQEDSTQVEEEHNEQILHLEDPIRIKNKGRPKKPVRLKAIVEEIKQKMAAQQAKKNKNPTSRSPAGKSKKKQKKATEDIAKEERRPSAKKALAPQMKT